MVLRYALLGLLAGAPMSGYELTQMFQRTLAHAWPAHHSQIYPELRRLLDDGLIVVSETGTRRRKTYAITSQGLDAVQSWLRETAPARPARNEAVLRTFLLWLRSGAEVQAFLDEERRAHAAILDEFVERAAGVDWDADDAHLSRAIALEWGLRYERAYLEWLEWTRRKIDERQRARGWGADVRRVKRALKWATRAVARQPRAAQPRS